VSKKYISSMKKQGLTTFVLVFWALVLGYGCGKGKKEVRLAPDWTQPELAVAAVEKYIAEAMKLQDTGIMRYDNQSRQVYYLKPVEVLKTEVRQTGDIMGEVGVRMKSTSAIDVLVDMNVTWDTTLFDKDSVKGVFAVGGLSFRQIGDTVRYRWEKSGNVYRKVEAVVQ